MKLTKEGSEIAAAIIAVAGTDVKTFDGILGNFFKVLAVLEKTSQQEGFPEVASFPSLD